jgi:hypothetical protein
MNFRKKIRCLLRNSVRISNIQSVTKIDPRAIRRAENSRDRNRGRESCLVDSLRSIGSSTCISKLHENPIKVNENHFTLSKETHHSRERRIRKCRPPSRIYQIPQNTILVHNPRILTPRSSKINFPSQTRRRGNRRMINNIIARIRRRRPRIGRDEPTC